ncbi:MAG: hydrogenase expression/formation protein HypE [Deferribacterota bacterium]|nr:hydrogenase expression/formation protein HypE [Deferribacterota bacterium]
MINNKRIKLTHGDGGKDTDELLEEIFYKYFDNIYLKQRGDGTKLPPIEGELALTTDSFTVKPYFFPGGDVGKLSICGTINDLVVSGSKPLYLTAGFIIEEGFLFGELEKIVSSMAFEAKKVAVNIVAGDTKVVGRDQVDGIFINTTGLGYVYKNMQLDSKNIIAGDNIIVTGCIGSHGAAVLSAREDMPFKTTLESDCASLLQLLEIPDKYLNKIRIMRDPTRGGLATILKELIENLDLNILLDEKEIPIRGEVKTICNLLGLDPLYLACEGCAALVVDDSVADKLLSHLHNNYFPDSKIVGKVIPGDGSLLLKTSFGGTRRLEKLVGEPLPRIC